MLEQIRSVVIKELTAVDQRIAQQFGSDVELIYQLSEHIFGSGGKRLRPIVVLLSAHSLGYKGNNHIDLAAVVELIHTATLLHDDVVDKSLKRRGNFTANHVWGNKASILVGDYIYSRSFQLMVGVGDMQILTVLANASNQIAQGEVLQLEKIQNIEMSEMEYMDIIDNKTATLFSAAAKIGAMLAAAELDVIQMMQTYGKHLGLAFQLIDDALDYGSSNDDIGKSLGDDFAEGKVTLPLLKAYQQGNHANQTLIKEAIDLAKSKQDNQHLFAPICQIIQEQNALNYALDKAKEHVNIAINALSELPDTEYKQALLNLADFAVKRSY
ncbi:MAG: polyprenyl synthetase family protein [Pseudomonadota bacterium]